MSKTSIIEEIARQTNPLALNAAIEAALVSTAKAEARNTCVLVGKVDGTDSKCANRYRSPISAAPHPEAIQCLSLRIARIKIELRAPTSYIAAADRASSEKMRFARWRAFV
jgi:hypothetical protein